VRPDPDPRVGQAGGHVRRRHALDVDQEGRHAAVHAGPPVNGDRIGQPVEEPLAERPLVGHDRGETSDRVEIVDGRVEAREQFVRLRAGFEAAPQRAGGRRARLVRPPLLGHLGPPVGNAEMRAAELVRRADQHVRADLADVDRLVCRVMDGVHPGERPGVVRELADPGGVGDRADRVRRPGERDHLGAGPELVLQVTDLERGVVVQRDLPDHQIAVMRDLQPGRDPGVVVQAGHEDLVAGAELARGGPGQREVERGHVRPEGDLAWLAAEEPGRLGLGFLEDLADADAGGVARAQVGARLAEGQRDRVADLIGHLRAAGSVEEREALPERGETVPDRVDVEARAEDFGHGSSLPGNAARSISNSQLPARTHISPLALAQTAMV